jgi:hypothetical protein
VKARQLLISSQKGVYLFWGASNVAGRSLQETDATEGGIHVSTGEEIDVSPQTVGQGKGNSDSYQGQAAP